MRHRRRTAVGRRARPADVEFGSAPAGRQARGGVQRGALRIEHTLRRRQGEVGRTDADISAGDSGGDHHPHLVTCCSDSLCFGAGSFDTAADATCQIQWVGQVDAERIHLRW
ncbi:hypothetical protein D3C78_1704990 [compost metagenome]